ncbi:hypothetical protein ACTNEO_20410 [Gracilibacillus sp. HCP3S3_G5_1]|uniref:hypothetical protein n=1 Tax=unclassified Gracilibacillus TaxID=2625209 RepID=UPI003F88FF3E
MIKIKKANKTIKIGNDEYEVIDDNTLRRYNKNTKMWVTLRFNNKDNTENIERFKNTLRRNFIKRAVEEMRVK